MKRSIPVLAAGLVLGLALGMSLPALGDRNDNHDASYSFTDLLFARAEGTLWAMQNVMVSLAVDTERSAIEIAVANDRIAKLERRLAAVEQTLEAAD